LQYLLPSAVTPFPNPVAILKLTKAVSVYPIASPSSRSTVAASFLHAENIQYRHHPHENPISLVILGRRERVSFAGLRFNDFMLSYLSRHVRACVVLFSAGKHMALSMAEVENRVSFLFQLCW